MSNDNNELKNNVPCEEKQGMRELTEEELENVNGGAGIGCIGKTVVGGDEDPTLRKVE